MQKITIKYTWLFLLIPFGMFFFIGGPQIQRMYTSHVKHTEDVEKVKQKLEDLKNIQNPTKNQLSVIKTLSLTVPIQIDGLLQRKFMLIKTSGMLLVILLMLVGMFWTNYSTEKKKKSSTNKQITFNYEDPEYDAIGQNISWEPTTSSGSNFLSEKLIKTAKGYKVASTNTLKLFAWVFLLMGLNYLVISSIEFYLSPIKVLTFMSGGKLFFSAGGPFVLVGLFLLASTLPKVSIHTRKRKIIILGKTVSFNETYALQLSGKFVEGNTTGGYHSYELNLVTSDGERYNLLNHGDKEYILSDMVTFSTIFKVPVWNRGVI